MNRRDLQGVVTDVEFQQFAEVGPHILWIAAPDGSTQYLNRRGTDYIGHPLEANHDWNRAFPVHPEDSERVRRAWEHAMRTETPYELEYRIRRADGEFRWHAFHSLAVRGPDGHVVKWIGTATDIDEQKQLESSLRRSQRQSAETLSLLETLQSNSPVGFGFVDRDFRNVRMNEALAAVNGAPLEQQIGRTVAELLPKLWPQLEGIYRQVLDTRKPVVNLEVSGEVASKPGETGYWLTSYYPVIVDKDVIGVGRVIVDISERKRDEVLLRAAKEQFNSVVEQSITGIYIVQNNRIAYVNARLAEIFGYPSPDEIVGLDPMLLVAERDRALAKENIRQRIEGVVKSLSYTFAGLRKDGSTFDVGAHGSKASYLGHAAVVGVLQDISEKKRAEDQIRRYVAQLEHAFMRTVEVAMTLSELRDPYTAGHERRVAELAVAIGSELGFDANQLEGLRVAGYLHDIGKIMIPAEILSKPMKLTPAEYELVKGHPKASFDVLKNVEFPWPVAQVALQHHERLDGSGYPQGLKGDAILLEARIVAVADVVEAMSSHRPYRPGLGIEKALAEIERGRGVAYHPNIVDVCLKLFREKGYTIPG